MGNLTLKDCVYIDYAVSSDNMISKTSEITTVNCRYQGNATNFFQNSEQVNCEQIGSSEVIFKEGGYYELVDNLADVWIGSDGSQIGLHGGNMPFDPVPTNPQITKFNVASKTSADGKLSVDIEVKAAQ